MRESCDHDCHRTGDDCPPCDRLHALVAGFGAYIEGYANAASRLRQPDVEIAAWDRGCNTAAQSLLRTWQRLAGTDNVVTFPAAVEAPAEPSTCPAKRIAGPGQPNAVLWCWLPDDHDGDHRDDQTIPGETWAWSTGLPAYQLLDDEAERPIAHLSPMP